MAAANRTPTLCTRSPTTWMNAALTLALPWLQRPCCWCWLGLWPLPCGTPDWWRISTILRGTTSKLFRETPLGQISTASRSYSQNIDRHSTTWGYEHDLSVDVIVSIDEPLYGRQDQRCCHCPDRHNWQQHAQDLWRTHQSTSKKKLNFGSWWRIGRLLLTSTKNSFKNIRSFKGSILQAWFQTISPHLLDATRRSWRLSEAGRTATERRGWSRCCQSQSEDAPHPSWWPDCEQRIHLQTRREARKQLFFPSVNSWSFYFCWPIISPAMKTRLTAQAMHSFLPARCLASLSGPDVETVCWQSRSDRHRSSSSEALWLSPKEESQQVSGGEPVLKDRTASFPTIK